MTNIKYRLTHLHNGLCRECSEVVVPGKGMCMKHLETYRVRQSKLVERRRKNRLCTRCGAPLDDEIDIGHVVCFNCRHNI